MAFQILKGFAPTVFLTFFCITQRASCIDDEVKLYLKTGKDKIEYKFAAHNWENIPMLLENVADPVTEVCATGTWLFYEKPHLVNKHVTTLNGITVFKSDTEKCFTLDELGHEFGSVQHVSSYHKRKGNSITFFEYENFIGRRMLVNKVVKLPDEQPGYYNLVKSVITIGNQSWVVVLEGPTRACFQPPESMQIPVCLISNLIDNENLVDSGVLQVYRARHPCNNTESLVIEMKDCYEYSDNNNIIHPNTSWPLKPPTGGGGGPDGGGCGNDTLGDEHTGLIGGKLNGSLGSGDWFNAVKDPKNIWKTELFDKCFQVFSKICPNSVIDKDYLMLFASLYFHHLGKVWDSGKYLNVSISDVAWMEIFFDMNSCIKIVNGGAYDSIAAETAEELKTYTSLEDITGKIESMLGYRPGNDHVMEINWLMANLVASICTKARDFDVNFLPRFLNAFHVLYFSPIQERWSEPEDYATVYKYIFGGYGLHKSLTKIALCTFNAMKFSGVTEPYKRPMDQTDKAFLPKVDVRRR